MILTSKMIFENRDLWEHEISDGNCNDLTDDGIIKRRDVDDWLGWDDNRSSGNENSIETKNNNGFDPFAQIQPEDYQSQRNSYKNARNSKSRQRKEKVEEKEISNESIMKIIQDSQQQEKVTAKDNPKHASLIKEPEASQFEKNIIVDNADLELEGWLEEGEEWMFKTFNRKKAKEDAWDEENIQKVIPQNQPTSYYQKPPHNFKSKFEDLGNINDEITNLKMIGNKIDGSNENQWIEDKPKRRKKNSKHRRTESKTFDKDFLQNLWSDV